MNRIVLMPFKWMFLILAAVLILPDQCAWALSKAATIDKEMNCVSQTLQNNKRITWTDVCYTNQSGVSYQEERREIIREELDAFQADYDYERQQQYENSKDYLEKFLKKSSKRDVVYESKDPVRPRYDQKQTRRREPLPVFDDSYTKEQYRGANKLIQTKLNVAAGHRVDNMDWSIAGNLQGVNPNVFTEYVFDDVRSREIRTTADLVIANRLVFNATGAYGEVYDGDNEVTEYDGNNRTDLAVRTSNSTAESAVIDLSAALGWRFDFPQDDPVSQIFSLNELYMTFLLGYSHHEQKFDITDGNTTIDNTDSPQLGPFEGLHSNYNTEWEGPFFGVELEGKRDRLSGLFRVEYHLADYYGWGQLNLRPEFVQPRSFEHTSEGNGWVMNLDLGYQLTEYFSLDFVGDLQLWNAKEGVDRLFLSGGGVEERQLNEVNWDSYALMLGATLKFD